MTPVPATRVLLVEDDPDVRDLVAGVLERTDCSVRAEAGTGECLRALGQATAVVVVTGRSREAPAQVRGREAEAALQKPVAPEALARAALRGRRAGDAPP